MRCIFYILLFSLFIICSCNTKDEAVKPIPDCSEKGMCEIMTCKVDGKDWYSDCKPDLFFGCDPVFCQFNEFNNFLSIGGASLENPKSAINLVPIISPEILGFHSLYPEVFECPSCSSENNSKYQIDSTYLNNHQLEITKVDYIKNVIEGNFNFRAIEPFSNDTVYITDGYFRLSYLY